MVVALLCVACAGGPAPVPVSGNEASAKPTAPASVVEQVGGVTFGVPRPEDLRDMAAYGWVIPPGGTYSLRIRPDIHGVTSTAKQIESGNYNFETSFRSPFGEKWMVDAIMTARLAAVVPGQEASYVRDTIRPLVKAWASDGALYTGYSWDPNLGDMRAGTARSPDEAAILAHVGWPLPYLSEARHELLLFYAPGVVLRTRWLPVDVDEHTVKVSREAAIALHVAAMRDPNAKSEEERTGRDYFLGTPYVGAFPPPEWNRWDDLRPKYDIPNDAPWYATLDTSYAGKPVWHVVCNWSGYGIGLVDGQTGTLIRFMRPNMGAANGVVTPSPFIPTPGP
jgi:hypothetical protein